MQRTLIVIPTYNEREGLAAIVTAVRAAVPAATVLVVDDSSPDGTGEIADRLAAADGHVRVKHRPTKEGLGPAYVDAFLQALSEGWEYIVQMDADFSHDPPDVPRLLAALDEGNDLAIGSRYVKGGGTVNWGLGRRAISRGGSLYARTVLAAPIRDLTGGFKAWRAAALRAVAPAEVRARGYGFQIEMTYRALKTGARIVELPIRFVDRRLGQSKMSGTIFAEALTIVWRLRLQK
ncbi:MAG TPA: polyprenol monophosphomannose synthase [Polyangia bacterium]|nr:polyprenol monophosphomannose synthase [Polyangia bacterium]